MSISLRLNINAVDREAAAVALESSAHAVDCMRIDSGSMILMDGDSPAAEVQLEITETASGLLVAEFGNIQFHRA